MKQARKVTPIPKKPSRWRLYRAFAHCSKREAKLHERPLTERRMRRRRHGRQ